MKFIDRIKSFFVKVEVKVLALKAQEEEHLDPWIFTIEGYFRQSELEFKHYWEKAEHAIVYVEEYYHNNTLVKRSVGALSTHGVQGNLIIGDLSQIPVGKI